ncbi:polysaccharide deacetylase familiy protein [Methylogaea oryzae]|uniref:Polysaccharide deacetylase familiy protein n=2 Tax=Methylogaea oryzae TaxID=1295382 RepID=A0A8D4VPU6_9GAMM|nr:polysaccharide deacetylase familiy protein [Methylogaea oryzae]
MGSTLLTLAAPVALAANPDWWPWVLAAIAAANAVMTFAGLWPRCDWVGPNWTHLPAAAAERGMVALTIDDGPDPAVTPAVLDLLDRYGAKATFFCIGERAERYPALCREIAARGHAVENHTMRHRHNFALLLLGGYLAELQAAQDALTAITGTRPRFFRAPAGLRNPLLDPVLGRLGLRLASWTRRGYDTVEKNPQAVLAKLLKGLQAGDILLLHDGSAARTASGRPVILEALQPLLEAIAAAGLRPATLREALAASDP